MPETNRPHAARAGAFSATIAALAAPPRVIDQSALSFRAITALRVMARCGPAGRDPLTELSGRLRSVAAATAFIDFADLVGRCWPERVGVFRPCACVLSPDERTFGEALDRAGRGDRAGFVALLDGFVRADRHAALYDAGMRAAAELTGAGWR